MKTKIILLLAMTRLVGLAQTASPAPAITPPPAAIAPAQSVAVAGTNAAADDIAELIACEPGTTLPDAIKMLAHSAKINYEFDPNLFNQVGANNVPVPIPTVEMHWENISPMQAMLSLVDNYGWQMIQNPKSKIYRVSKKDPAALDPLVTKVIQLKYSNPTNIAAQLLPTLSLGTPAQPRSKIIPDVRTSQLIIMTTEKELPGVEALIARLDTASREVLIEAILAETTRNPHSIKGIDWSGTLQAQNISYGNGTTTGTATTTIGPGTGSSVTTPNNARTLNNSADQVVSTATTLATAIGNGGISANTLTGFHPATAFLNADGIHAVLSFLNTDSDTESIALPSTVAMDGVETELSVVRNIPVFEQEQGVNTGGSVQPNTVKPNYVLKGPDNKSALNEVGITLKVTPRIVGGSKVLLDLKPEISAQEAVPARVVLNGQPSESPIFNRRRIMTQATVPSGYTLVIGGLNNDNTSKNFTKVPILGDLPIIGLAFRHDEKERTKQNLLIFVTPTIVEETDFQKSKSDFLKTKFTPRPDSEETAWDSGKPLDWTKPNNPVEPTYQPKSAK